MKALYVLIFIISFGLTASAYTKTNSYSSLQVASNEIVATITKDTSENQFDELVKYFNENDIDIDLSKIEYNDTNEITGIQITLSKGKQQSNLGLSQNTPIANIELGLKDGNLFIESEGGGSIHINSLADLFGGMEIDEENPLASLLGGDFFSFNFDSAELEEFMSNDFQNFDFNNLRDQLFSEHEEETQQASKSNTGMQTYNFINKPGVNKLIIIDGEESDFKTLNKLAKKDMLADVDNLKASTAMSLYGKKAKDGAIIATTKN